MGKIIGAIVGLILGHGWFGFMFGFLLGAYFDRGYRQNMDFSFLPFSASYRKRAQQTFFKLTFAMLGHMAKADGRVSEGEIRYARSVMQRFRLNSHQKQEAIRYFQSGKESGFSLDEALNTLMSDCHQNQVLLHLFVDIQMQAAVADGQLTQRKRRILASICERLGFMADFNQRFGTRTHHQQHQRRHYQRKQHRSSHSSHQRQEAPYRMDALSDAYQILGVTRDVADNKLKQAYRKLMGQYHPDKLIAKGLPEQMIRVATDKVQDIQKAYELIKEHRRK